MINKLKELRAGGEEEGFTLIELMIVVVIIGILAAIAIPIFANQQKNAINAGLQSDVKNTNTNIVTALVKKPTATGFDGTSSTVGSTDVTAGGITYKIVVSDSKSTVKVEKVGGGAGANWDGYQVVGDNSGTGATVTYDSSTGKTDTTGN